MSRPGGAAPRGAGLGTFGGVVTPSILTILGLVLFRRLGFVVGGAGVGQALVILALGVAIAVLTALSLSAIATNLRVKRGGDYYLISRSLGVEFGGAIGTVLFLAQSISIAFYCVGLGEAVAEIVGPDHLLTEPRVTAGAAVMVLFALAFAGADVATRAQYVIMAALGAALVSFFTGAVGTFSTDRLAQNWADPSPGEPPFWVLFAIFFPAMTGFTQGVSMSGDLRDPGRSLPLGTFIAIGIATVVYLGAVLAFGGALPATELAGSYDAMSRLASVPALVLAGLLAATLSSALASFLGAPRILQALAADNVLPVLRPFAAGHGPTGNPRRGVVLSLGIAVTFIALGDVNTIAPVVSMFFLISYGLLNYATAFEARANSPSFRPRFRWFHYRTSLLGAFGCLAAMVMISPVAAAVAIAIVFALHQFIDRLAGPEQWADARRDHYFYRLRTDLLALAREPEHPRNWRPRIITSTDQRPRRARLLRFASWIEGDAGLTTVVRILEGRRDRMARRCRREQDKLQHEIDELGIQAFALVVAAPDPEVGAQTLLQSHGIGPLRPNVALLNWMHDAAPDEDPQEHREHERAFARQIRTTARIGVNVVALDVTAREWQAVESAETRRIDVWWEDDESSRLMLLLAYMMTRTEAWADADLRVLTPAKPRAARRATVQLNEALEQARIDAEPRAVPWDPDELVAVSRDASLVFLPLRLSRLSFRDPFGNPVAPLLDKLGMVAMVLAAEDIELAIEPDEIENGGEAPAAST